MIEHLYSVCRISNFTVYQTTTKSNIPFRLFLNYNKRAWEIANNVCTFHYFVLVYLYLCVNQRRSVGIFPMALKAFSVRALCEGEGVGINTRHGEWTRITKINRGAAYRLVISVWTECGQFETWPPAKQIAFQFISPACHSL